MSRRGFVARWSCLFRDMCSVHCCGAPALWRADTSCTEVVGHIIGSEAAASGRLVWVRWCWGRACVCSVRVMWWKLSNWRTWSVHVCLCQGGGREWRNGGGSAAQVSSIFFFFFSTLSFLTVSLDWTRQSFSFHSEKYDYSVQWYIWKTWTADSTSPSVLGQFWLL